MRTFGCYWFSHALLVLGVLVGFGCLAELPPGFPQPTLVNEDLVKKIEGTKGVALVLGLPKDGSTDMLIKLASNKDLLTCFLSPDAKEVTKVRQAAVQAKVLGTGLFVIQEDWKVLPFPDNLVSKAWVSLKAVEEPEIKKELLRVLHPGGHAILVGKARTVVIEKPFPPGGDSWSHPYHGPDNSSVSEDKLALYPYRTQFLGYPMFGVISEVCVASGGRMYLAFGHQAKRAIHNEVLNKLYCINAFNGAILWTRPLKVGFMIQRNTMIATPDKLYLADDESCKVLDAKTGKLLDEITPPLEKAGGTVWKWMGLDPSAGSGGGMLYALLGGKEYKPKQEKSRGPGFGHWGWGKWKGYDYKSPDTSFGFGRNFLAIDLKTKKITWHHREDDLIDSRGVCMSKDRLFYYIPGKKVGCLDPSDGHHLWARTDKDLLEAIGKTGKAQHWKTGFSPTVYMRCHDAYLFFNGPQRPNLVALSVESGKLIWQKKNGNFYLIPHKMGLYAVGRPGGGFKLDYKTGDKLGKLLNRNACTVATSSTENIFYRASGGTYRYEMATGKTQHIAPMRPGCQNGVIIADGMLHWTPWICGCRISLYGNITLAPAGVTRPIPDEKKLTVYVKPSEVDTKAVDLTVDADDRGAVWAKNPAGQVVWKTYVGMGVNFQPELWKGRVYLGSNDGYVYCLAAKTGDLIWRFHAAPEDRLIPVYNNLMSTWPVAGGVVLREGVVYAAAGIAHYDGTHVYALDAMTGKLIWHNDSSGSIGDLANGVSLQGKLAVKGGELQFCGGNAYAVARYNLKTGVCINGPSKRGVKATTFYAVPPGLRYAVKEIQKKIESVFFARKPVIRVHDKAQDTSFEMVNNSRFTLNYVLRWSTTNKPFATFTLKPGALTQVAFVIPQVNEDAFPQILWTVGHGSQEFAKGKVPLPVVRQAKWDAEGKTHFKINRLRQVALAPYKWKGIEDCSADVKVEKTDKGLKVVVDVTDDVVARGDGVGTGNDGVELYLDVRSEKVKRRYRRGYRKGVVMVRAIPSAKEGEVQIQGIFSKKYSWAAIPGITITSKLKDKGYIITFFVPWDGLKKKNFLPVDDLRFDIGINDVDKGYRKIQMMWSGDRESWRNPFVFGYLVD